MWERIPPSCHSNKIYYIRSIWKSIFIVTITTITVIKILPEILNFHNALVNPFIHKSQDSQAHFKNLGAFAARILKFV